MIGSKLAMYCAERRQRVDMGFAHADIIGKEDHVELGALGGLRQFAIMRDIDAGVGLGLGVPPGRDVVAGRVEKRAEPHFLFRIVALCIRHGDLRRTT